MKKILLIIGVAFSAIMFASCGGIDSELDAYEKACESKDPHKIAQTLESLDKHEKSEFTDEQLKRFSKITIKCSNK